jgi:ribonuclease G
MSKEMIVSVNGREKKIAIIENDQVTEFYIERGEDNQGIVGNIYKGRVMRVLPGMQSAFVDIGLERDAFLYVSDFFDEEEEFERIVMDKAKKGDMQAAARAAAEHIEQARIEREQRIEATQERAEPLRDSVFLEAPAEALIEAEPQAISDIEIAPEQEQVVEKQDRERAESTVPTFGIEDDTFGRKRNKRKRQRERDFEKPVEAEEQERIGLISAIEDADSTFGLKQASFERVIDDQERAADEGELLKDAIMQERLTDQIHAVEFDVKDKHPSQVGSMFAESDFSGSTFERVSDDADFVTESASDETSFVPEVVTTNAAARIDEELDTQTFAPTFERVSDDEEPPVYQETGAKSKRNEKARSKKPVKEKAAKKAALFSFEEPAKKSRGKKKEDSKPASTKSSRKKKSATGEGGVAASKAEQAEATSNVETAGEESFVDEVTGYEDAEASVTESHPFAEFATRRGGRRRRRPRGPLDQSNGHADESANEKDEEEEEEEKPERGNGRRSRSQRSSMPPQQRRAPGGPPMITDLLRESQEILVQIAKEPISKKGARITSHIALPGRYLVYMPTVEHVGVSRKIESANERIRLRNLIQRIRNEENVPSGGFIVRTAGVGISDDDLRDDARYLVRTWLDIRKGAEKTKAPALVHQDLDLVQRILRDQLSGDFAAIRVDSEEEYLRIVEFINRIQPRLVNRVKLYTRDESILEAFGVQSEIDKAIKPRVWLKSGGYLVINQTEALVSIDVNTGKFVGKGSSRLEDTITKTNLEAVEEIARQIRLRDLGGIIVMDLIDMEERRNRQRVLQALHEALQGDKSPTKVLSFNDFGLVIMTRKRVKQSLERTLCAPCSYCQGAGLVKSPQTVCYEILEEARRLSKSEADAKQTTLRINPEVARALRGPERDVLTEIEDYLGAIDITSDERVHQEQFDFAFV